MLSNFDPNQRLVLQCDASETGLGARKACNFRKSCIDWYWNSICTDRKRVISCRIWTWKVPPVHMDVMWQFKVWPKTFGDNTEKASSHCTQTAAEKVIALTEVHNTPFIIILVMRYAEHIWETLYSVVSFGNRKMYPIMDLSLPLLCSNNLHMIGNFVM